MGTVLSRAVASLLGIPVRLKLYAAGAVVLALLAILTVTYFTNLGYERALNDVRIQNQNAVNAADRAAAAVERCIDTGGVYDQSTGQCRR